MRHSALEISEASFPSQDFRAGSLSEDFRAKRRPKTTEAALTGCLLRERTRVCQLEAGARCPVCRGSTLGFGSNPLSMVIMNGFEV